MNGKLCPNRVGTYVPWSWGEVFTCTKCGKNVRQSHHVQSLPGSETGDDILYPIPEHTSWS